MSDADAFKLLGLLEQYLKAYRYSLDAEVISSIHAVMQDLTWSLTFTEYERGANEVMKGRWNNA